MTIAVQAVLKNGVKNYFDKNLEKFKERLKKEAERRKLDFERKIHDFSLYSTKRHELYPEMYKQLYKIWREIKMIEKKSHIIPSVVKTAEGIIPYYEGLGINLNEEIKGYIKITSIEWSANPENCTHLISEKIKGYLTSESSYKLNEVENYYMDNILYFSDEISSKLNDLIYAMLLFVLQINNTKIVKEKIDEDKIQDDVEIIERMFKKELNIGDYELDENK